jgi:hypothetical protein
MLQISKNELVTRSAKLQMEIRQKELRYYEENCAVMGVQSAMLAGWLFDQVKEPVPMSTPVGVEKLYVSLTATALGCSLCIVTWSVMLCIRAPGLALRGTGGSKSIDLAVLTLKEEQDLLYYGFLGSLILYFLSAVVMVFVYKSNILCNLGTAFVLGLFLTIFMYHWYTVESNLKPSFNFTDGNMAGIASAGYGYVEDLDQVACRDDDHGDL